MAYYWNRRAPRRALEVGRAAVISLPIGLPATPGSADKYIELHSMYETPLPGGWQVSLNFHNIHDRKKRKFVRTNFHIFNAITVTLNKTARLLETDTRRVLRKNCEMTNTVYAKVSNFAIPHSDTIWRAHRRSCVTPRRSRAAPARAL